MPTRVLILCTGNSCRSQMAEGFLSSFDASLDVVSAGTTAAARVHPMAVQVMREIGIDLSKNLPKMADQFVSQSFDYVVTVCDNAHDACPVFIGTVKHRVHIGFDDPADAVGTEEEILGMFRKIRDEIKHEFYRFYSDTILKDTL